jgi:hypothetical protein
VRPGRAARGIVLSKAYPAWLLERSFGGLGTADSPGHDRGATTWPDGPSSPMAREACDALLVACNGGAAPGDPRCLVFLVGGAGNGKSKLAADTVVATKGKLVGEPKPFAQRAYQYALEAGGRLRVINDATIPPADKHDRPLVRDLEKALQSGDHLLACINRGVLIGEAGSQAGTSENGSGEMAQAITHWLLSGRLHEDDAKRGRIRLVEAEHLPGHYSVAEIWERGIRKAVIHVVYMDSASLLESWGIPSSEHLDYRAPLPFGSILITPVLHKDRGFRRSAFHGCVTEGARAYSDQLNRDPMDPVAVNVASLSNDEVATGWCSLLRGAEIISGTHFTYRELWALFAQSVVGPANKDGLATLSAWVDDRLREVHERSGEDRLTALLGLGCIRTHMLLFDAGKPIDAKGWPVEQFTWPNTNNEALRAIGLADPLRHFGPSGGEEHTRLAQRLAEIEEGRLPGHQLAREDAAVARYWSALDAEIERAIRDEVDPANDHSSLKKRNWLLGWYGRYMYRLVGLARGWSAHCSVVNEWQEAWLDAERGQRLSHDLEEAILDIVAPSSDRGSETYFTFLQPRVDSGEVGVERAMIGLPRNRFEVSAKTDGDRVELRIDQGGYSDAPPAASAILDFHMLREAMARRNGHGFTDSLMLIEPRIERIRASLVTHQLSQPESRHRFKFVHRGKQVVTR